MSQHARRVRTCSSEQLKAGGLSGSGLSAPRSFDMRIYWILLCAALAPPPTPGQATHTFYAPERCLCNGRSRYCLRDAGGLHCVDCQGNTAGRHCERCKHGFYQQGAGLSCTPCGCNPTGSVSAACDSRGRCSCIDGVTGDKCGRCPDGPIGPNGCSQSRRPREDSGSQTPPCFCYGHSSRCSAQSGYSVHSIVSTFATGPDGWTTTTALGVTPDNVLFRWSPKHQDVEVISKNSMPIYLSAPAPYLGNQLLSYGQNFSFSLRLDRGVRHPSTNDVVVEGGGLRVSASLGDLRSIVPCGQKISYSFRLDERPGGRWRPQLSSFQFQTLLQNITSIRIRATFGENGRGYLDNVKLVSARRGDGVPAGWVQTCSCPPGYEGESCERCSAGFRRRTPADGGFSACERCSCRGGSCDPQTGDCYSADQTAGEPRCSHGFYRDPRLSGACLRCPCPGGGGCSVAAGSLQPQCDRCPPGTTGARCDVCQEGFYRRRVADDCRPCDCDVRGSESERCDAEGRCRCRSGFEGPRCRRPACPACFSPVQEKMEAYGAKLEELQALLQQVDGGLTPAGGHMEATVSATEQLLEVLQQDSRRLAGLESSLQGRLSSISSSQLAEGQDLQNIAAAAEDIERQQQAYDRKVEEVQELMEEMRRRMEGAKDHLRSAELPVADAPLPSLLSSLVQTASSLADQHQAQAAAAERSAADALSDSEKSLALVRSLMTKENRVRELVGALKSTYDHTSAQVKALENQGTRLSSDAADESKMADAMLKDISGLQGDVPASLKEGVDAMMSRLAALREEGAEDASALEALQDGVQRDKTAVLDLLGRGRTAQQESNKLLDRVNAAKGTTEEALRSIHGNTKQLDDALRSLTGFDQQINASRALAAAAIQRLPGISAAIRHADSSNAETQAAFEVVSDDYSDALGTIEQLESLVTGLQGSTGSLPSHSALLSEASKLKQDAEDLQTEATDAAGKLKSELDAAERLEGEAEQAAGGAAAALTNARRTRAAVGKMLQDVSGLLADTNEPGAVDEERLQRLEASLAGARRQVEAGLRRRLQDAEQQEAAQRRQLSGINLDIDSILRDIANLEDILRTVPKACFNSPPIEEA